jgi:hypothetical protein
MVYFLVVGVVYFLVEGVMAVLAFLMVGQHQKKPIVAVCGTTLSEILYGLTQTYPCKKNN